MPIAMIPTTLEVLTISIRLLIFKNFGCITAKKAPIIITEMSRKYLGILFNMLFCF